MHLTRRLLEKGDAAYLDVRKEHFSKNNAVRYKKDQAVKNPVSDSTQGLYRYYSVVYGNKAITLARLIATVRAL